MPLPPLSYLNGKIITTDESTKFLGLRFDQKLKWTIHIKIPKGKCHRALNILKHLAHTSSGCNRNRLLIQPKIDYGAPTYGLTNKSTSKICTRPRPVIGPADSNWSFPYESIYQSLRGIRHPLPLSIRRILTISNLYISIAQNHRLPIFDSIFDHNIPL